MSSPSLASAPAAPAAHLYLWRSFSWLSVNVCVWMCSTLWLLIGHSRQVGAAPPPAAGRSYAEHKDPAQRVNCKIKKPLPAAAIKLGINLIFITAAERCITLGGLCTQMLYRDKRAAGRRERHRKSLGERGVGIPSAPDLLVANHTKSIP